MSKRRIPEPDYIKLPPSASGGSGIKMQKFGGSVMFYGTIAAVIATQATVAVGGYDPHFGAPLFAQVYYPIGIAWLFTLTKYPYLHTALVLDGVTHAILLPIAVWLSHRKVETMKSFETHERGSARWSDIDDLAKTKEGSAKGLVESDEGLFIGAVLVDDKHEQFLIDDSPKHVATFSPSRGGKGQTMILNTLLTLGSRSIIPKAAPPKEWSSAIHALGLAEQGDAARIQPPAAPLSDREPNVI